MFISNNKLKMLDFQANAEPIREIDLYQDDLKTFYLVDMQSNLDFAITKRYLGCFAYKPVWLMDDLVDTIRNMKQVPNLSLIPRDIVIQKILLQTDVKMLGKYVIMQ